MAFVFKTLCPCKGCCEKMEDFSMEALQKQLVKKDHEERTKNGEKLKPLPKEQGGGCCGCCAKKKPPPPGKTAEEKKEDATTTQTPKLRDRNKTGYTAVEINKAGGFVVRGRRVEGNADYIAVIKDTELSLQIGRGVISPRMLKMYKDELEFRHNNKEDLKPASRMIRGMVSYDLKANPDYVRLLGLSTGAYRTYASGGGTGVVNEDGTTTTPNPAVDGGVTLSGGGQDDEKAKAKRWEVVVKFLTSKDGMGRDVTQMFRDLDTDGSGDVDIEEFTTGLKGLGLALNDEQFEGLYRDCDEDGDGTLTLKEFINQVKVAKMEMVEKRIKNKAEA
jgi:hypothetical protein